LRGQSTLGEDDFVEMTMRLGARPLPEGLRKVYGEAAWTDTSTSARAGWDEVLSSGGSPLPPKRHKR